MNAIKNIGLLLLSVISLQGLNVHDAVRDNDFENLKKLVEVKRTAVNSKDESGNTAIMIAACEGREPMVRYLLKKRAMVNETNSQDMSALMFAAKEGHKKIVELLIQEGADMSEKDVNGKRAWQHAEENGHSDIVDLFRRKGAAMTVDTQQRGVMGKEKASRKGKRGESAAEMSKITANKKR